ncbi:MAG TPA: penicillin-binding protein, partial [Burkholderiales bacterium]|nr:penicillin-binding protein [Burkholderiales bacterium]
GTAARAESLGRRDLAGKTGTTENFVDAWFDGYNPDQVAVSWMGFDQPRTLGNHEAGARAALPIWMDYMRVALKNVPDKPYPVPPGVVQAPVDLTVTSSAPEGVWNESEDYFYAENAPQTTTATAAPAGGAPAGAAAPAPTAPAPVVSASPVAVPAKGAPDPSAPPGAGAAQ